VAKAEQVAAYFCELAAHLQSQGYGRAHFFLDNNTTHLNKMKDLFAQHSGHLHLQVSFHHFPKYSPKLNVVEYLIHLIRAKWLHHSDYRQRLETVAKKLADQLHHRVFLPKEKIANILHHIHNLVDQT